MANIRTNAHSFNGGEVTPEFYGQIGDAKFQTGLATCRNFICKPQGPIENRPGLAFVRETKYPYLESRLIPFTFSTTQTIIIEMGSSYFRFHTNGATVMDGAVPYEVAHPYYYNILKEIQFVQSGDVLTLVHTLYAPMELRRLGATNWVLNTIAFTPSITPPATVSVTPDAVRTNMAEHHYVVTAMAADGYSQSVASYDVGCVNNIFANGSFNTIAWTAVAGASAYIVYKRSGGAYGYIGRTTGLSLIEDNIAPDLSRTPPIYDNSFTEPGRYPGAVSYYEQRRCFAGAYYDPQKIWMTRSGTESDMSYSLPVRDDDRISFRVAAREANAIRHIVPMSNLILLTSSAEWKVTSVNSDAITPTTITVRPQSYIGASQAQPVVINNNLLYGAARGGHLREMSYSWQANGYASGDLSLRAAHLFDDYNMTEIAYCKAPIPIVWAISTSGKLLGLTYVPEQQVGSWHQHDTDGTFESCAVVAEGNEDALYVIVNRTIGGQPKRYIERMASRRFATPADAFFVDSGATYSGAPVTTISNLTWLEGKAVSILADGFVHPQRVVTAGTITLDYPASKIQVGLPIVADMVTLPLAAQTDPGYAQGRQKNVNKVWLRVVKSGGIQVGPDADSLVPYKQRTTEVYGAPVSLKTEEIEVDVKPSWGTSAQIMVRQTDPLPLTLVSMTMEVAIGN